MTAGVPAPPFGVWDHAAPRTSERGHFDIQNDLDEVNEVMANPVNVSIQNL